MAEVGRPTKLTDEVRRKIEEVAALDGSVEEMAYYAGVHRETVYNWMRNDKDFSDRIQALRERPILKARQTIAKSLDDPIHAKWYLERKKRLEFTAGIDVTSDGKAINFSLVEDVASKYETDTSTDTDST